MEQPLPIWVSLLSLLLAKMVREKIAVRVFFRPFFAPTESSQAAPNNNTDSHDNGCAVSTSSTSKQGVPQNAHGADTVENSFEPKTSGNWSWESIQCHKPHLLLSKIVLMWGDKGDSGKDQLSNFSVCGERVDKKGTILVSMHSYSIRVYCHDSPSPYVLDCRKFCRIMLPSLL